MTKLKESSINTIIGEDTSVNGDIRLDGNIIIYGKVEGNIHTDGAITLSPTAHVSGQLQGKHINIGGKITGNLTAEGKVVLGEKAILKGDIRATHLVIEDGAKFEGNCNMQLEEASAARKKG